MCGHNSFMANLVLWQPTFTRAFFSVGVETLACIAVNELLRVVLSRGVATIAAIIIATFDVVFVICSARKMHAWEKHQVASIHVRWRWNTVLLTTISVALEIRIAAFLITILRQFVSVQRVDHGVAYFGQTATKTASRRCCCHLFFGTFAAFARASEQVLEDATWDFRIRCPVNTSSAIQVNNSNQYHGAGCKFWFRTCAYLPWHLSTLHWSTSLSNLHSQPPQSQP